MKDKPTKPPSPDSVGASDRSEIFWDLRTVTQKTGLSRATIYRYMARGAFPPRRKVGPGRVAWLASEVISWSFSRPVIAR
ncbi:MULTISPECIES: AlpA family phage regulatory protein [Rhodomicrobium]|uniref:helix-turn-helix transcriptional regulator n=1 Tax=Rhodomicrobium TaxID=1068 RepID=UPI000B4AA671|nr:MULTISPECIES: AlpA family phage regulatory protein [Rhodomicrobium]